MERLTFSYNWNNKLSNKAFTTLRLWNPAKYHEGNTFTVRLVNKQDKTVADFGVAAIVEVKRLQIFQISDFIAYLDTGYSAAEAINLLKTMYKNKAINWDTQALAFVLLTKVSSQPTALQFNF